MNFSAWSIRNPVPAILLFVLLTAGGLLAFERLAVQNFPDMDLPTVKITASLEGAAPAQLETEVARKIEDNLASLSLLDHITTTITDGSVSISVSFKLEKDSEEALNEVRNAVDSTTDLPSAMESPSVTKVTVQSSPLLTYAIRSTRLNETELSWFVDNDMTKALLSVSGVGEVSRVGGIDREIHVDLNPQIMGSLGITAATISSNLKSVQADTSGGRGEIGGSRQTIRTLGAVASLEELKAIAIPLSNGELVRLDEIGEVTDSFSDRTSLAYLDGQPVIGVQVKRSNGFSDTGVAADVEAAMKTFAAANPDVEIVEAYSTVGPIIENYDGSMHMLYEGAILAVVVVWLFLRDWRATFLSAVALPLSVIPTFLAMYFADFSLNTVTLLALSLVVGILVDDAIVEVENIARHLNMGKSPMDAALEAADEIGLAVIATTFTLVAVFLPTAFMSGIPGLIFRQFGVTAAVAVLASLLVARLLTPMMAAYMMKAHPTKETEDGRIMRTYMAVMKVCLGHRKLTVLGVCVFLGLSLSTIPLLSSGFLPASDDAQTKVTLSLPPGSTIEQTDAATRRAADIIAKLPDVTRVFSAVGSASSGAGMDSSTTSDVTSATLVVNLTAIGDRDRKQSEIENDIREALAVLPGVRVEVGTGGNGTTLEITLASDDTDALDQAGSALEEQLRTLQGIGAVTSSASLQAPEIQIVPDFTRAAALGVTSEAVSEAVRVATNGDYSSSMAKLNLPQRQVSIRVRLDPDNRTTLDDIASLRVSGTNGNVDLGSIADIRIGGSPSQIDRIDRSRNITLSVELNGRILGDVNREAQALPALKNLPQGVRLVEQGELQRSSELFESFGIAMAIGVFCIYAVLVLLFHDFLQPVTILMALPLSLGGALLPLVITSTSFSMSAVIGLLMLMGVVTKNSILLVEYAIMARRGGMSRFDALVDACHKRARPIVMTTIAMGCGMLPVALSLTGGDGSFRQPMAIVVIGGLLTSTFLSLLVIPVIFTFVDDFEKLLKRPFRREQIEIEVVAKKSS
ncbi:efflux RND transporter permease subunit [Agrobacterium sp. 22-221-1]|uniref:efflux RND transporter permease subunit n=1 Tax=Agrobacterium leguminum TaxID=2792015 RepID=UPI003CE545BD